MSRRRGNDEQRTRLLDDVHLERVVDDIVRRAAASPPDAERERRRAMLERVRAHARQMAHSVTHRVVRKQE